MMSEESKLITLKVAFDISECIGLRGTRPAHDLEPVLTVECFGTMEEVRIVGRSLDAVFVLYVVMDRRRTKEYLVVKVLDRPENGEVLGGPEADYLDAGRSSLVGQAIFDLEKIYLQPPCKYGAWVSLTRPDSGLCHGWLKYDLRVTYEDHKLPASLLTIPMPIPQIPVHYQVNQEVKHKVFNLDFWKIDNFASEDLPVRARTGQGQWVSSRTNPKTGVRLTLFRTDPWPDEFLQIQVGDGTQFVDSTELRQIPKWVNLYGGKPLGYKGRVLMSGGVVDVDDDVTFTVLDGQAWGFVLEFMPTPALFRNMTVSKGFKYLMHTVVGVRERVFPPRAAPGPHLPPPPSGTSCYVLRVDLHGASGISKLIESLKEYPSLQVEVSWGASTVYSSVSARSGGDRGWCEHLKEIKLEVPTTHAEMPLILLNVTALGGPGHKPKARVAHVTIYPTDLENSEIFEWRRLEGTAAGAYIWLRCSLTRLDVASWGRPGLCTDTRVGYEARIHVWHARNIINDGVVLSVRCGKELARRNAKKRHRTPSWGQTICLPIHVFGRPDDDRIAVKDGGFLSLCSRSRGEPRPSPGPPSTDAIMSDLHTADLLEVTLFTNNGCSEGISTMLPFLPEYIVRNEDSFDHRENTYHPRRPQWVKIGGHAELLLSIDILRPDLAQFYPIEAYPLRPAVKESVLLECTVSDAKLACLPCGVEEGAEMHLTLSLGRYKVVLVAYQNTRLQACMIPPVAVIFPAVIPQDELFEQRFLLEVTSGSVQIGYFSATVSDLLRSPHPNLPDPMPPLIFASPAHPATPQPCPPSSLSSPLPKYTLYHRSSAAFHPITTEAIYAPTTRETGTFRAMWRLRPYTAASEG
eukprot:TRINITY_DN1571_c0_g1_i1.p1 TRINITY_DN1571_c0_g1~~TRINITY_DN1571_c0_g1_i1.p1  ORF type:complete len:859 (+),score=66.33 TRINITY_DN1571_c0_g1_i1:316-2892(+)